MKTMIDPVAPSKQDAAMAGRARQAIASGKALTVGDLPPPVARLLVQALEATEAGSAVSLFSVDAEFGLEDAARFLNMSPDFVGRLVESGALAARRSGEQRLLTARDLLAWDAARRAQQSAALDEMAAIDQELGLI